MNVGEIWQSNPNAEPPKKKPRTWRRGTFNEDPFIFFDKDDEHLAHLKHYYDIKAA